MSPRAYFQMTAVGRRFGIVPVASCRWMPKNYDPDQATWALADGPSPRGHQHVVVTYDGEVVFDPHPSRAGLVSVNGWATFKRGAS